MRLRIVFLPPNILSHRYLGPAEITAWCVLRVLWNCTTSWLSALSYNEAVRSESHVKNNRGHDQKTLAIVFLLSLVTSTVVLLAGYNLPESVTDDELLQGLLNDLLPFLGIGIVVTGVFATSWNILSAKGEIRLATFVMWLTTWFITIPLATICTIHLRIDLQGQTLALLLGSMLSGSTYLFSHFSSQQEISKAKKRKARPEIMVNAVSVIPTDISDRFLKEDNSEHATKEADNQHVFAPPFSIQPNGDHESISSEMGPVDAYGHWDARSCESSTSSGLSSILSSSATSLIAAEFQGPSQALRVDSIPRATSLPRTTSITPTKNTARKISTQTTRVRSHERHAPPSLSPLMEEETSTSSNSSASGPEPNKDLVFDDARSADSTSLNNTLLGYRPYTELGRLSRVELLAKQRELDKMLNAIRATLRYDLGRSKERLVEDLQWVLLESPDIFEVHHLERIIAFLSQDQECRDKLWTSIQQYLPVPLQRMGLEYLLSNNYLGAHHLKSRMERFVTENQVNDDDINSIQDDDDVDSFDDERVHTACELPNRCSSAMQCFVIQP